MRTTMLILVMLIICTAAAAPVPKSTRTFGPEWTKKGNSYHRTVEVKAVAPNGLNGTNYTLPLEKGTTAGGDLLVYERIGDDPSLNVDCRERGKFEVRWDKKGKHTWHMAWFGEVTHIDLDGDGMIDMMVDDREKANAWYIYLDEKRVRIGDASRSLNVETIRVRAFTVEVGNEERYLFEKGKWRVETDEDRKKRAELERGGKKDPDK